ncbi:hypothetical protein GOODEAATRI_015682, partial [Goodea atripinnis]
SVDYINNCLVGTNVTMESGLQTLDKDHDVIWTKGRYCTGKEIASYRKCVVKYGDDFNNLFLNVSNGDLTITEITENFSRTYCVQMLKGRYPHIMDKHEVMVYDPVSVPNITKLTAQSAKNVCGANCSVENGPGVNLTWYKRDIIVGQISNQNTSTLTLLLEIQPENIAIYSCCAQNPVSVERKTLSSECPRWIWCCSEDNKGRPKRIAACVAGQGAGIEDQVGKEEGFCRENVGSCAPGYWPELEQVNICHLQGSLVVKERFLHVFACLQGSQYLEDQITLLFLCRCGTSS